MCVELVISKNPYNLLTIIIYCVTFNYFLHVLFYFHCYNKLPFQFQQCTVIVAMCVPFLVWLRRLVPARVILIFHHSIHASDLRIIHQVLNHPVTCIYFHFLFITKFFDQCATKVQTTLIQALGPERRNAYLRFPAVYSYSSHPPEVVRPVAYSSHARNIIVVPG